LTSGVGNIACVKANIKDLVLQKDLSEDGLADIMDSFVRCEQCKVAASLIQ